MRIETDNLITIANFAIRCNVSTSYIYILARREKITFVTIDGVHFVDTKKYKELPTKKK